MSANQFKEGLKVRYHGGWNGLKDRCEICQFQCGYIYSGEIVERYQVWDVKSQKFVLPADELWTAKLETGSYAVGYPDQFEEVI